MRTGFKTIDLRLLPLLLVLLTCNSETRQAVSQTIQYIVAEVCQQVHCGAQTKGQQSSDSLILGLPQTVSGVVPSLAQLEFFLTALTLILLWLIAVSRRVELLVNPRAPPYRRTLCATL